MIELKSVILTTKLGKTKALLDEERSEKSPAKRHLAVPLKRVFNIDKVNWCEVSREGTLGYIEDPAVIPKTSLRSWASFTENTELLQKTEIWSDFKF